MTTLRVFLALVLALGTLSQFAHAGLFMEVGDAGNLPGTAQLTDVSPLTLIQGTLGASDDIDVFKIFIDDAANFSATVTANSTVFDSQLFLFSEDGLGVVANDDTDTDNGLFNATIPIGSVSSAGFYYLAIAEFADKPVSAGGLKIFPDPFIDPAIAFDDIVGPSGPGGPGPVEGWVFEPSSLLDLGDFYEIELTGARGAVVGGVIPEPSTLVSLSVLLSLAAVRCCARRRRS